ncbi:MAG: ABC transporter substrate-binding protein [Hyphomicrobiaceae bacterium]
MKRLILNLVLAASAGAMLAAPVEAQTPKRGGVLSFSIVAEPPTLDCHATTTFATIHPVAPAYNGLLRFRGDVNKKLEITGDLSKSWEMSKDGLTYTFKLHDNVKFHDGSPMTSADVKASYERIVKPPAGIVSARQALHREITSIDTPDAGTVVFKLSAPNASMMNNFASPFNCVYSAKKLAENPRYPETEVLGTGPFKFKEYTKGSSYEGARFDGYFEPGKPYLDGYKVYIVKSNAVVPGMQGGQFDAEFRGRTPKERDQLVEAMKDKVTVMEGPWTTGLLLVFNTQKKPFDDVRVRRALTMAIDRWGGSTALSKISMLKFVGGFTRTGSEWALPEAELVKLPGYAKDAAKAREEAKRLLKEAGVENLKIKLVNRNVAEPYTPMGIYVVDQWRRIGVETDHQQLETKLYFDAQKERNFDATIEFIADYVDDPSLQFQKLLTSKKSSISLAGHEDTVLDELFDKQSRTIDPAERLKLAHEFDKRVIDQAYAGMLYWWQRIVVLNAKIKGWELHAAHFTGQDLSNVWLDQ